MQARELRRRLRRNPNDEEAQQLLSKLLQRDTDSPTSVPSSSGGKAEAVDGGAGAAPASAVVAAAPSISGIPETQNGVSRLGAESHLRERARSAAEPGIDEGALANMLSKEIQETLHIEDQNVSLSLASRFLHWWRGACETWLLERKNSSTSIPFDVALVMRFLLVRSIICLFPASAVLMVLARLQVKSRLPGLQGATSRR